jgi:uncharacterized protein YgiM (DUF1202 family)
MGEKIRFPDGTYLDVETGKFVDERNMSHQYEIQRKREREIAEERRREQVAAQRQRDWEVAEQYRIEEEQRKRRNRIIGVIIGGAALIITIILTVNNNPSNSSKANVTSTSQTETPIQTVIYATVTSSALNVRRTPSAINNNNLIEAIRMNTRIEVLEKRSDGWVQIRYSNGRIGYVDGSYLSISTSAPKQNPFTETTATSVPTTLRMPTAFTSSALNVRRTPSAVNNTNVIEAIQINTTVEVLERRSDGWVRIRYANGKTGYVDGRYLSTQTVRTITPVNWKWSENRISLGTHGWSAGVLLFNEPITNCLRFTLNYEFRIIKNGNPYGTQDIYVMNTGSRWDKVGSINVPNNNSVTTTIHLNSPTTIQGIGIVPAKPISVATSYENWFTTSDFVVNR